MIKTGYKQTEEYRIWQRLRKRMNEGIKDFSLVEPGDHILIGVSGGKDSLALLELMGERMRHSKSNFRLSAVHIRMSNVAYRTDTEYLKTMAASVGISLSVRTGNFEPDRDERRSPCFLCSWNRRKILFETARDWGCNKIALGHHQDDILQTALMNLTFNGSFSTMPARLRLRKFPMTIIRPLCKVSEVHLHLWAKIRNYHKQDKICPYDTASNRTSIKKVFNQMEALNTEFRYNLWHALLKEGKLTEE